MWGFPFKPLGLRILSCLISFTVYLTCCGLKLEVVINAWKCWEYSSVRISAFERGLFAIWKAAIVSDLRNSDVLKQQPWEKNHTNGMWKLSACFIEISWMPQNFSRFIAASPLKQSSRFKSSPEICFHGFWLGSDQVTPHKETLIVLFSLMYKQLKEMEK